MVGNKVEFGVSIYPDFCQQDVIKEKVDEAKSLGYKRIFTSIQLGDLGFENTSESIDENFNYLFDYAATQNMICHVDINDTMLYKMGCSVDNLEPIYIKRIPVIRIDGGFTLEEISKLTMNPYGIIIEENLSSFNEIKKRIDYVYNYGNIKQYCGCHNFFPRNDTGLSLENAIKAAEIFQSYGCEAGIFIGSLLSKNELNSQGHGVPTLEKHRYIPSHIQAMELFASDAFDYIIFGDSQPHKRELVEVMNHCQYVKDVITDEQKNGMHKTEYEYLKELKVIDIPVYFEGLTHEEIKIIEGMVYVSRQDISENVIRGTQLRGILSLEPNMVIERKRGCVTVDNILSNRYTSELQICLNTLSPSSNVNVVGYVKPFAEDLLKYVHGAKVAYRLKS